MHLFKNNVKLPRKLTQHGIIHHVMPILAFVLLFAIGGTYYLMASKAATIGPNPAITGSITSGVSGKCLDDWNGKKTDLNRIDAYTCNGSAQQVWTAETDGTIQNRGGCMDVYWANTADGTPVDYYQCNGTGAQVWKITGNTLVNPESGKCLTEPNTVNTAGVQLTISTCNGSAAQVWNVGSGSGSGGGGGGGQSTNCAPAKADTMTNTVSHLCGFPDTTTAGVPAGTTLQAVGSKSGQLKAPNPDGSTGSGWTDNNGEIDVTADGAVLENISTTDTISVTGNNATIKNVQLIQAGGDFGIAVRNANNVTVEHSTIAGNGRTGSTHRIAAGVKDIYGDAVNLKVLDNNIYYTSTAVQTGAGDVEGNYIHDMGEISTDHINGTTSNGSYGNGAAGQLTLRDNTVFNQYGQTDAISLFQDFSDQSYVTIDDNLMAGGGYTVYGGEAGSGCTPDQYGTNGCYGPSDHIVITNNHFSKLFYKQGGQYGPVAYFNDQGTGNVFSGNVWDDTGAALNL